MEIQDENIVMKVEEQVVEEVQESMDVLLHELHQCPVCLETFRISKTMFDHMLTTHKSEKHWKISDMLNIIEAKETLYSSDSDCDYEISIEITKRNSTKDEFKERLLELECQREPLKVVDGSYLTSIMKEMQGTDSSSQEVEVRVQCPKCDRTFSNRKNLRSHIKLFHVEETGFVDYDMTDREKFECPECSRELSDPRNLRKHLKLCHNKNIRFVGMTGKWGKVLTWATEKFKIVQKDSGKDFPIVRGRDKDTGRSIFKCGLCGFGPFLCARAIKRHQTKMHGREPLKVDAKDEVFRCDQCDKEFWAKDNLSRHMKLHSDAKNYVCNFCGNAYKTSAVLRKHKLAHVNIKCLLCMEKFYLKSDYKSHHKAKHENEEKSFENAEPEIDLPKKQLAHIPKKVEEPIKCDRCRRIFTAMCGYKVHKCVENERNICVDCGSKFRSKKSYLAHDCPKIDEDEEI